MTLIAALVPNGHPVLLGDLLLSGPERPGADLAVPTVGAVENVFPKGSGWAISGLRQKVAFVSDRCVMAWAGSCVGAKGVFEDLKALATKKRLTPQVIENYFRSLDEGVAALGVSFLGFVRDERGVAWFGYNYSECDSPLLGRVRVAGSGSDELCSFVMDLPRDGLQADGEYSAIQRALSAGMAVAAGMLQIELSAYQSLLQFFGAGYELLTIAADRFQKIGDVTYVFWQVEWGFGKRQLNLPACALKFAYRNDLLLVRATHFRPAPHRLGTLSVEDSFHCISPLYRAAKTEEVHGLERPDLNSTFTVHCILVVKEEGDPESLIRVEHNSRRRADTVRFKSTEHGVELAVAHAFVEQIARSVSMRCGDCG